MPMLIGGICHEVGHVSAAAVAPFALLEVKSAGGLWFRTSQS
jgi:hypothetical protein